MTTILHEQRETTLAQAHADGDALWLAPAEVERATGWQWKPEGLCQADTCMPLPRGEAGAALVRDGRLDLAGFWRSIGHPVARDDGGDTWVLGTGAAQRAEALASLEAPDFSLPDLAGNTHRLSDYRGRKVLMASWASW